MTMKEYGEKLRDKLFNYDDHGHRILLVDADIVAFRHAIVNQEEVQTFTEEGLETSLELSPDKAKESAIEFIWDLMDHLDADEALLCFTGPKNFRKKLGAGYKHNRVGLEKPKLLPEVTKALKQEFPWIQEQQLEADDLMGLLQTDNSIICTIDKDLDQIVGHHFNWDKVEQYDVSWEDALHFLYLQILTGDPGDGYSGLKGIGPVKANKILEGCEDDEMYLEATMKAYEDLGYTIDDYRKTRAMAEILHRGLYDFKKHKLDSSILKLTREESN